jgi:hypothetical protein
MSIPGAQDVHYHPLELEANLTASQHRIRFLPCRVHHYSLPGQQSCETQQTLLIDHNKKIEVERGSSPPPRTQDPGADHRVGDLRTSEAVYQTP